MITIKRGDTARTISDTLLLGGSAIDLSGASVRLVWQRDGVATRRAATIVDAAAGHVSYSPVADDVAVAGRVQIEWEITFSDDSVLTVPTQGYYALHILADLG